MGVGTNILGYANNEVDNAVIENIKKSNMSTFLCEEEITLIERLTKLHPGLSMVDCVGLEESFNSSY